MDLRDLQLLKTQIKKSGYSRKEIAAELEISYSLLSNYLGGFIQMPSEIKDELDQILNSKTDQKAR